MRDTGLIHARRRAAKVEKVERRCLACRESFSADGPFNRICPTCKNQNWYWGADSDWRSPFD